MKKEIWKYINGFYGEFSVSNYGRVRSETRWCEHKRYGRFIKKGKLFVLSENSRGYLSVTLSHNGKSYSKFVHRLVAEAFIPNPANKPQVNHIDGNRKNNTVDNLEWATQSENNLHSYRKLGRIKIGLRGKDCKIAKVILQIKGDKIIAEFYGTMEAERVTGICHQDIGKVANGKHKSAGGYIWKWK